MHVDDQVIFVHNPRTSGTAIRRALLHGKDPNANISPPFDQPGGELIKNRKHVFARQARAETPADVWDSRFKFAVVRNPWDRVVSLYGLFHKLAAGGVPAVNYRKLISQLNPAPVGPESSKPEKVAFRDYAFNLPFKEWLLDFCEQYRWNGCRYLDSVLPMTRIPQVEWFDGLDWVFKFEQRAELNDFLRAHGYEAPAQENASWRTAWRDYYDAETFAWVAQAFKDDIERFEYAETL
jgi:hypothetical protein